MAPDVEGEQGAKALDKLLDHVMRHTICSTVPWDETQADQRETFPVSIDAADDLDAPGGLAEPSPEKFLKLVADYQRESGLSWGPLDGKEQSIGGIAGWLRHPGFAVPFVGLGVGLGILEWTGRWEMEPDETIEQFSDRQLAENTARFRTVDKPWKPADTDPSKPSGRE